MKEDNLLTITMISDFICPWCFISERRLKEAAKNAGIEIKLTYKPYELNPEMPEEGMNRKSYRSAKFGSWERSQQLDDGTVQASKDDPLSFNYEAMEKTPNTSKAHRLIWYVQQHAAELEEKLVDAIFEGYFSHGKDVGKAETLAEIASEVGLDKEVVLSFLLSKDGAYEVKTQEQEAIQHGIQGVPHIRIGEQKLYGAESSSNMRKALKAASQKIKET